VGFKSAKYFSTCFRHRFNETPSHYIQKQVKGRPKAEPTSRE
jgi:AraC-like DNA-binding protein